MANATSTELQELYIAYFGRAADPTGLDYWTEKGTTASAFAATQHAQPEFKDRYGSLSTEAQVNQIYKNLFDREADVDGLTYWTQQINLGNLELADIAVDLIWAAKNNSGSSADKTALENRTNAAVAYTAEVKKSTSAILAYAPENDGKDADADWVSGDNITEAVSYLSGIDGTTTYTAAGITASVNTIVANGTQNDKKTFTLTTGLNNFTGGDSSDTFDASTALTLNNGDTLDGGGGTDTITAKFSATTTAVNSKNIEKFVITATGATTLNFADSTGITSISNQGSTANLTLNSLNSIPTYEVNTNAKVNNIEFSNAALAGSADEFKVTLSGMTNASANDNAETLVVTRAAGATNDLETLHIVSSTVANAIETVTTTAVDTTTLKVSGDQNLVIEDSVGTEITTVDASDATGDVTVITGYTKATTVTGGSGSDTFTTQGGADTIIGGAGNDIIDGAAGNDTIEGGTGNDTLTSSGTAASLTGGAGNDSFKLATIAAGATYAGGEGTDQFEVTSEVTLTDALFAKATSVETITFSEDIVTALTLGSIAAATGVTKVINNSDEGEDSLITVGIDFTNALEIQLNHAQDDITASSFTKVLTVDANTVTLASTNSIVGGSGTDDILEMNGVANASADISNITGFENFNVNADAATSFTFVDANGAAAGDIVIDATAITSTDKAFTLIASAEADANVTIKGGAGADVITITQSSAGGDSITGGTGNDTFKFTLSHLTSADSINGGDGTDILELGDANDITDAKFTNVTSVETLTGLTTVEFDATLSTYAAAAGITTVNILGVNDADDLTVEAGFTNDLTVNMSTSNGGDADGNDDSDVDATNYTKKLTVNASGLTMATGLAITGGTGTSDTLLFTGTANASTNLDNITKMEIFKANTDASASILIAQENATADESLHIDGSKLTSITSVFTVNAAEDTDAKVSITGGAGNDLITMTSGTETDHGDTVNGGAGNDTFYFDNGELTKTDTVNGGAGTDTLEVSSDASTVADIDFTGVSNVENFTITAGDQLTLLTLDSIAAASGLTKVITTADSATHTINVTSGFSSNLTVDFGGADTNGSISLDASATTATAYSGVLSITAAGSELDTTAATIDGGSGTSDTITVSGGGTPLMTSITNIEKIAFASTTATAAAATLVDGNAVYTNGSSYETFTIDGSALTSVTVGTFDTSAELDSKVIVIGGAGNDIITASSSSNFGDSLSGGSGNDRFQIDAATDLTSADTIDGGAGTDTLRVEANATTLTDAYFTNITNVEKIDGDADAEVSVTLGAQADEAGITTIVNEGNGGGSVTVLSAFDNALSVELNTANVDDKVDASGASNALTVKSIDADFEATDTVKGGSGTSDTVELTAAGGTATTTLMTGIETITVKDGGTVTITMGDNDTQIASGKTLTVNATALTSTRTLTFNGSASEDDGYLNITGSSNADTIVGAASNDTISGGTGADSITGMKGADSITGGGGADAFVFTAVNQSNTGTFDTLVDWTTGTDKIHVTLDYSALSSAVDVNSVLLTAAAGTTAAQDSLSAKRGEAIYDKTNEKLLINVNNDNLFSTQDYVMKVKEASTEANSVVAGDIINIITGTTGADTIVSGGGADTITGNGGADSITGGAGADSITGNSGADTLTGGTGGDTIVGAAGANSLVGGAGADSITATTGTNTITGGDGDDTITATTGANSIVGGDGADSISTTSGNDTITGGEGADTITGGAGADTIVMTETTAAIDTLIFSTTDTLNGLDVATTGSFDEGSGGDVIKFNFGETSGLAQTDLTGTGASVQIATATNAILDANAGCVIFTAANVADSDAAETAFEALVGEEEADIFFGFSSDDVNSNTGVITMWELTATTAGNVDEVAMATFTGKLTAFTAHNFSDFAAIA